MTVFPDTRAWIDALRQGPDVRIDRLLRHGDSINPYQRGTAADAAASALAAHGTAADIALVDGALADWLRSRLAEPPSTVSRIGWNAYIGYLKEAFALAAIRPMPQTGELLRERHRAFEDWTAGLSQEGPGDMRAHYLIALAHNQGTGRGFLGLWLRLCEEAGAGKPYESGADFYLGIGLLGRQQASRD